MLILSIRNFESSLQRDATLSLPLRLKYVRQKLTVLVIASFSVFLFIFYRANCANAVYAVIVMCPSVRLSVTSRSCTKTAKPRITQTAPYDIAQGL